MSSQSEVEASKGIPPPIPSKQQGRMSRKSTTGTMMMSDDNMRRESTAPTTRTSVVTAAGDLDDPQVPPPKSSLNSYYGNWIGFLQSFSLLLNAGMMVYAHVGLSGVVYSSQDPDIIDSLSSSVSASTPSGSSGIAAPTPAPTLFNATNSTNSTALPPPTLNGDCSYEQDLQVWIDRGGFDTRKFDSNYCAREHNGGCLLSGDCLQECFQSEFGYTPACSVCFANINPCVSTSSCLTVCAGNSLGDTCQSCLRDTPCDSQFYACSGLPEDIVVFQQSQQETPPQQEEEDENTGACNDNDEQNWIDRGGYPERGVDANYCAREYGGSGCLADVDCLAECSQTLGYSDGCSQCFANLAPCVLQTNCLLACVADSSAPACLDCLAQTPCDPQFFECTGLPQDITDIEDGSGNGNSTNSNNTTTKAPTLPFPPTDGSSDNLVELGSCGFDELEEVEAWYDVYNLTFAGSIQDAWESEVYGLAIMIVVFSGIWPYAKNIALVVIWYLPMTDERRSKWLLWLSRLSKYTLVDVYAVIMVLVGVQLDLNIGGITAIIRAEARFAIIAFLLATVWEFIQIEWMQVKHTNFVEYNKCVAHNNSVEDAAQIPADNGADEVESPESDDDLPKEQQANGTLAPRRKMGGLHWNITLTLCLLTVGLYIAGATLELVRIENYYLGTDGTEGCVLSYNLGNVAIPLVNEVSFEDNEHKGQNWTLFIFYILFAMVLPITVHLLQITYIYSSTTNNYKEMRVKAGHLAGILWGMASVEVFLLGLFAVEYKFEKFITSLAGEQGAQFIDVQSYLGPGFILLIIYSIAGGLLQFYLRIWWLEKEDDDEEERK